MPPATPIRRARRSGQDAFSLIEIAMSLGIVGFVLAGLIGAIPLASSVGRQSVEQTRAASIASTIFATLRAGKFSGLALQDDGSDSVVLNSNTVPGSGYCAYFDDNANPSSSDSRRLHIVPASTTATPAGTNDTIFQVKIRVNNNPPGTLPPSTVAGATHAQASAVEVSINSVTSPKDSQGNPRNVYVFSSVIANRAE